MNISPRTLKYKGTHNHQQNSSKLVSKLKLLALIILPLAATSAIVNYRIALRDKINHLERASILEEEKLKNLALEIENLQVKRSRLRSWPHIKNKLAEFKLDLHVPLHGQVVALRIEGEKPVDKLAKTTPKDHTATVASR